ncbi:MAG TPA: CzcE family metal-binding protein [Burkholderiales bacterium]|nr:CzcE family metal-binding protein [Burkholderiales bacterium]
MKLLLPALAVLTLSAAALSARANTSTDLYGERAQAPVERSVFTAVAGRTIDITGATKWVNVTHGEVVRFVSNGQEFTWYFDGVSQSRPFDLAQIAPAGFTAQRVTVYVAPGEDNLI